jgi:hypothetical protein
MAIEVSEAVKDILSAKTLDEFDAKIKSHGGRDLEVYLHEAEAINAHRHFLTCKQCQGEVGSDPALYAQCLIKRGKTKLKEM